MIDAIIDSAGGDIMGQAGKYLKQGGRVVCYGMYVWSKPTQISFVTTHLILAHLSTIRCCILIHYMTFLISPLPFFVSTIN